MIKLTKDDVGQQFNREDGHIVTMISHHKYESVFSSDCGSIQLNCNLNGFSGDDPRCALESRHDSRPWLKDMPDASNFRLFNIHRIHSNGAQWFANTHHFNDSQTNTLESILMPKITKEQSNDSLITIDELEYWQLNNKG